MAPEETQPSESGAEESAHDDITHCGNGPKGKLEHEDPLLARIEKTMDGGVGRVLAAFDEKLRYDQAQQTQLDRLHAELQEYRSDLLAKATRPLVYGMIRIHSDIGRLCSALCQEEEMAEERASRTIELLRSLREDVELELGKHGVVPIRDDRGEVDSRRQRVLRRTLVGEPELDGVVETSIQPGFEQGEYILVKESVSAYKFDPSFSEDEEAKDSRG